MSIKWRTESRQLKDLSPYFKNPRIIKGKKFDDLKKSIEKFGIASPLIINTNGVIIGGHARFHALVALGHTETACLVPDVALTAEMVAELNIRLNKNIAGEWDSNMLANMFDIADLKEWGFEEFELGLGFDDLDEDDIGDEESEKQKAIKAQKKVCCPNCDYEFPIK